MAISRRRFLHAGGIGARKVFEAHRESANVRDRYGMHPLGPNLLLVRPLVAAGSAS